MPAAIALAACVLPAVVAAQQTLFNVPSADVLAPGRFYLEEDTLWRPGQLADTFFAVRAVAGLGDAVEAGVNVSGLVAQGRSVPAAILALKWQPLRRGVWAVTVGVHGLAYLRGAGGSQSAHAYTHAAWSPTDGTRITAGAWYATTGYASASATGGVLAGVEQRVTPALVLQADWYSGRNGIGYLTPGFALTIGRWVVYGGWSLKNGEHRGNAALIELGRFL